MGLVRSQQQMRCLGAYTTVTLGCPPMWLLQLRTLTFQCWRIGAEATIPVCQGWEATLFSGALFQDFLGAQVHLDRAIAAFQVELNIFLAQEEEEKKVLLDRNKPSATHQEMSRF